MIQNPGGTRVEDPRILVSGASGVIGTSLVRVLTAKSMHVVRLVRDANASGPDAIFWDLASQKPPERMAGLNIFDAAVHLSGANVAAHRWTLAYKRLILDSRVDTTRALCRLLVAMERPPSVLVCASAVGIYGDRGNEIIDESSGSGSGFLAETCKAWEAATAEAEKAGIRVVHARFGVVLTPGAGALVKFLPLFRLALGGKLGNGRQWMSWISLPDAVAAIVYALEHPTIQGPINVTSPHPVTNGEFTRTLAHALHRPAVFAVPATALRLMVGEMADEALLAGCRVLPSKLLANGFTFADPELGPALRSLLA